MLHDMPDTCSVALLFLKLRSLAESVVLGRGSTRLEVSYVYMLEPWEERVQ